MVTSVTASDHVWLADQIEYRDNNCFSSFFKTHETVEAAAHEYEFVMPIQRVGTTGSFARDNINTVLCSDTFPFSIIAPSEGDIVSKDSYFTSMPLGTLGATRTWYFQSTGEIVECDIWLNSSFILLNLRRTAIHEFGHCLGLSHVDIKTSIMYAATRANDIDIDTARTLIDRYETCVGFAAQSLDVYIPKFWFNGNYYFVNLTPNGLMYEVTSYGETHCK